MSKLAQKGGWRTGIPSYLVRHDRSSMKKRLLRWIPWQNLDSTQSFLRSQIPSHRDIEVEHKNRRKMEVGAHVELGSIQLAVRRYGNAEGDEDDLSLQFARESNSTNKFLIGGLIPTLLPNINDSPCFHKFRQTLIKLF